MTKILITVLGAIGIGLLAAPVAAADEDGFIVAIESLDYYSTVYPQDTISVGYRVCGAFARGGDTAAIAEVLRTYNGPGQSNPEYYATLFAQYSAYELCPQHSGEIGQI